MGRSLMRLLLGLILLGLLAAAGLMGFVYSMETHLPPIGESDVIIVLGAQVKEDGTPSVALERRLTAALEHYEEDRQIIIVCGAQGANEPRAEGDVMRDWLLERGVLEEDVIAETASFNTRRHQRLPRAQSACALPADGHFDHGQGQPVKARVLHQKSSERGPELDQAVR